MFKKISSFIIASILFTTPVLADTNIVQINYAGKERMLSQKLSKEIFMIAAGHNKEENLFNLRQTADAFSETLEALKYGDDMMDIEAVESEKIQKMLNIASNIWRPIKETVDKIVVTGTVSKTDAAYIYKNNFTLVRYMSGVVKQLEAVAALNGYDYKKAIGVNVAGRQRMLIQKASKEYFMIQAGLHPEKNAENLQKTIQLFETSLKDLKTGNQDKNIKYQANPYFQDSLTEVSQMWNVFKDHLQDNTASGINAVANKNLPLLSKMNTSVMIMSSL